MECGAGVDSAADGSFELDLDVSCVSDDPAAYHWWFVVFGVTIGGICI